MRGRHRHASQPAAAAVIGELIRLLLHDDAVPVAQAAALLRRLEDGVRVYAIEYRAFLNGQGQRPPVELEAALTAAFDELAHRPQRRPDLGFRLESLEARFHADRRLLLQRRDDDARRTLLALPRAS